MSQGVLGVGGRPSTRLGDGQIGSIHGWRCPLIPDFPAPAPRKLAGADLAQAASVGAPLPLNPRQRGVQARF